MKKIFFTGVFILLVALSYSQTKVTTNCKTQVSCSQKNGTTIIDGEYTLTVIYDNKEIKFTTYNNPNEKGMNKFSITKKTDDYIIATNNEGNYSFFNIKKKQFYYIDYFMNRFMTAGYGSQNNEIKQTTEKMIELLKSGSTQKDVIQYLIKQSEYDF